MVLVQRSTNVTRPREAGEFNSICLCTEYKPPTSPFIFIWINSNHTTIHQLNLQPSCSSLGPAPPKAPVHLFPGMPWVADTQQDAATHAPSLWSCRGIPTETPRPRLASPLQDQYVLYPPRHQRPSWPQPLLHAPGIRGPEEEQPMHTVLFP